MTTQQPPQPTVSEDSAKMYVVCGKGFNWFGNDRADAEAMVRTYHGTMYVQVSELDATARAYHALREAAERVRCAREQVNEAMRPKRGGPDPVFVDTTEAGQLLYQALDALIALLPATEGTQS